MFIYYKLDGKIPVPCTIEEASRSTVVKQTNLNLMEDKILISTVFLGMNHGFGSGPPILFETMIFGGLHNGYQERYHTWEDAEKGHEFARLLVMSKLS